MGNVTPSTGRGSHLFSVISKSGQEKRAVPASCRQHTDVINAQCITKKTVDFQERTAGKAVNTEKYACSLA
jgi:hypothetical protein